MMISASECSRKKRTNFFYSPQGREPSHLIPTAPPSRQVKSGTTKKQLSTRPAPPANPDSAQPLHLPWRYLKKKENQRWSSQRLSWKPAEETWEKVSNQLQPLRNFLLRNFFTVGCAVKVFMFVWCRNTCEGSVMRKLHINISHSKSHQRVSFLFDAAAALRNSALETRRQAIRLRLGAAWEASVLLTSVSSDQQLGRKCFCFWTAEGNSGWLCSGFIHISLKQRKEIIIRKNILRSVFTSGHKVCFCKISFRNSEGAKEV